MDNGGSGTTLESWDLDRCRSEALWKRTNTVGYSQLSNMILAFKANVVFITTSEFTDANYRNPTDFFLIPCCLNIWDESISVGINTIQNLTPLRCCLICDLHCARSCYILLCLQKLLRHQVNSPLLLSSCSVQKQSTSPWWNVTLQCRRCIHLNVWHKLAWKK